MMDGKSKKIQIIYELFAALILVALFAVAGLWLSRQEDTRESVQGLMNFDEERDIDSVSTTVNLDGNDVEIDAFYMEADDRWGIVMPVSFAADEIELIVTNMLGTKEKVTAHLADGVGSFEYKGREIGVGVVDNASVPSVVIKSYGGGGYDYLIQEKTNIAKGKAFLVDTDGDVKEKSLKKIKGHGNDSWSEIKKSFSIEFGHETGPFGMDKDYKFNLICGFRDNSLPVYIITRDMYKELNWDYAPEYTVTNLYIDGQYLGLYFLTEKMTVSKGAFDLKDSNDNTEKIDVEYRGNYEPMSHTYENGGEIHYLNMPRNTDDVSGGYLLEMDPSDYDENMGRFVTSHNIHMTMKNNAFASEEQARYIYEFFQDFEDAVYSEDGYNSKGKYYADYIDMESFADQWLMYEFAMESDVIASIYYYKDADSRGDGKLHAVWPWDTEHSFKGEKGDRLDNEWLLGTDEYREKAKMDFWARLYDHEDFVHELRKEWKDKYHPMIEYMLSDEVDSHKNGVGTLNWYYVNYSDPFTINSYRWPGCSLGWKIDSIREAMQRRRAYIDSYLIADE